MDEAFAKAHPVAAFFGRFLRGLRTARADAVGRWFKHEKKRIAHAVVSDLRDGTSAELSRVRRKAAKARMRKQLADAKVAQHEREVEALRASHAQLLAALMRSRGQWIHSALAEECIAAVRAAGVSEADFPPKIEVECAVEATL
jgi:hypothetical protein